MSVTVKDFLKWALQLDNNTNTSKQVWIFPAPFCAIKMLDDARYTDAEPRRPSPAELKTNPTAYRQNNVEFVDGSREKMRVRQFCRTELVQFRAMRNIAKGDELYISYGDKYNSFNS